jgi:hypothetical protein
LTAIGGDGVFALGNARDALVFVGFAPVLRLFARVFVVRAQKDGGFSPAQDGACAAGDGCCLAGVAFAPVLGAFPPAEGGIAPATEPFTPADGGIAPADAEFKGEIAGRKGEFGTVRRDFRVARELPLFRPQPVDPSKAGRD